MMLELPDELHLMIFSHLDFGDLERLRRTCHHYRQLLTLNFVRRLLDGPDGMASHLTAICQTCLDAPGRDKLILQSSSQGPSTEEEKRLSSHQIHIGRTAPLPVSSKCFDCAVRARDLHVGTHLPLADGSSAWVCRWCGWPVGGGTHSWAGEQFHIACYDRYYRVLWLSLVLSFAQFAVGVVAATLSLMYFRGKVLVFAPTVVSVTSMGF
jgi:hypothetical protein